MTIQPPAVQVPLDAVQGLRNDIADIFQVADTTLDVPEPGYVRFRGQFLQDPAVAYDELRRRFERHGFTPMLREQNDRPILLAFPAVFRPERSRAMVNAVLLTNVP